MPKPKTYDELAADAAAEWRTVQAKAAQEIAARHEQLAQMPDVKDAPAVGVTWECAGIACARCGWATFTMLAWTTVNGRRHRARVQCRGCEQVGVWDWEASCWFV